MLFFDGALGLIFLALWIFCFIDVLLTPEAQCRNLPKLAWIFLVLLIPDLGSIAWLVAGHPWDKRGVGAMSRQPKSDPFLSDFERPNRYVPANPDDDEEFQAQLRKRADEQRRRGREANGEPGSTTAE